MLKLNREVVMVMVSRMRTLGEGNEASLEEENDL